MKKLLAVTLSATAGFLLATFVMDPHPVASGGLQEKCAAQNGDVNADGNVDITDAITILGHLFLGSPTELVPLCAVPPAPAGLPGTGQSKCYGFVENQGWVEMPCAEAVCSGQDGSYATGCPSEGRFTDNGNGTVTDHCTDLMWQKDTADVNGTGSGRAVASRGAMPSRTARA